MAALLSLVEVTVVPDMTSGLPFDTRRNGSVGGARSREERPNTELRVPPRYGLANRAVTTSALTPLCLFESHCELGHATRSAYAAVFVTLVLHAENAAFTLGRERLSDARRAAGTLSALEATAGLTSAGCVAGTAVRGRG